MNQLVKTQGWGSGFEKGKNYCIKCGSSEMVFNTREAICKKCGYRLLKKQYSNAKKSRSGQRLERFMK